MKGRDGWDEQAESSLLLDVKGQKGCKGSESLCKSSWDVCPQGDGSSLPVTPTIARPGERLVSVFISPVPRLQGCL